MVEMVEIVLFHLVSQLPLVAVVEELVKVEMGVPEVEQEELRTTEMEERVQQVKETMVDLPIGRQVALVGVVQVKMVKTLVKVVNIMILVELVVMVQNG
jgi:hypothetical protein